MSVQLDGSPGPNLRQRITTPWPMRGALVTVAAVWLLGCAWSYREQSEFAAAKGFTFPHLLPLVIDGLAVAMAGVSWAASLDARPAVPARLATLVAVAGSAASNGTWAWIRTGAAGAAGHDRVAVALGVAVPVAANLAFEVLLAELRRQVQRGRGLPPPVAIPQPRLVRVALAPWTTLREWRALVLDLTQPIPASTSATYLSGQDIPAGSTTDQGHPGQRGPELERPAPPAVPAAPIATPTPVVTSTAPIPPSAPIPDQEPAAGGEPASTPSRQPEDVNTHRGKLDASVTTAAISTPTSVAPQVTVTASRSVPPAVRTLELITRSPVATSAPALSPAALPVSGKPRERDARVEQLLTLLRKGEQLTGVRAARILACSDRTGRRLLRAAQELHNHDTATRAVRQDQIDLDRQANGTR